MTSFLLFAFIGYGLMAIVAVLDKFIVSKSLGAHSYAFYSTIFFLPAFLLLPFSEPISSYGVILSLISGLTFGYALWFMMLGLKDREATHIIPFIGASTTVSTYLFSSFFLGEVLLFKNIFGVGILILACLLFSYERSNKKEGRSPQFYRATLWGLLSGISFGISHVVAKQVYIDYSFLTGFIWTKGFVGIVALMILLNVNARKELFSKRISAHKNPFILVLIDKVCALLAIVFIQYAIAIGSVAIVSSLIGVQYALTLIFILILSARVPRIFYEYTTNKELITEITAIILTACGVFLLI